MNWGEIGQRIRCQREYFGYTRERFAEMIDVTPKFCSDIETGAKGMSVATLYRIAKALRLSTDYILTGQEREADAGSLLRMLGSCSDAERRYAEQILKIFLTAMNTKEGLP